MGADRKGMRIQCSSYKESGSRINGRRVYLDDIEALAIKGSRQHVAHPEVITEFVEPITPNASSSRSRRTPSARGQNVA